MLDDSLLAKTLASFEKKAFVPMPGGQTEPVAGASQATAAMGAPMGAPPQGGAMPPGGGMPPGGAALPQGGAPPELLQMLNDPTIMQTLQEVGIQVDPATGSAIDTQTGQPIPAEDLMMAIQEMMAQSGGMPPGGAPAPEGAAPPAEGAPAPEPEEPAEDPVIGLLTEIRDLLAAQKGSGESKPKSEGSSDGGGDNSELSAVTDELRRTNDLLSGMVGGGGGY